METQTYKLYSILVRNVGFLDIKAISIDAAIADINEAYYEPEVITWSAR